ncbi:hypothetical protein TSST111916_20455 [Tsukamurella strandjordii]
MNSSATLTDRYPTRLPEAGIVMDRPDPVIWPGRDGPWAEDAVEFFGDNGYRSVEGVLDAADLLIRICIAAVQNRIFLNGKTLMKFLESRGNINIPIPEPEEWFPVRLAPLWRLSNL